ncbi:hypothetical protein PENSOL_c077G06768 [Penicillium solitum]|uniref:HNH nuclease domain-containing protein n=1 Tax=Penicillium solitum TaxID=60172 RepID=A0A1V6QE00_9EURO|nr:uncharacterized protein PENSOL_c077G06768 [Penicillium solitum]OQD87448.1 hypothetical protein PENSOL_c077G06768 [Penicillium solitum]
MVTIKSRATGQQMPLNTEPLEVGDYDIFCARDNIELTDDMCVRRVISHSNSDEGAPSEKNWGDWSGYEAAHIFPMEKETLWNQHNLIRWITNTTGRHNATINSVQNGMLVGAQMHGPFDNFLVSVNPDDGYKTTHFGGDGWGVDGRVLDPVCRDTNDPNRVADNLLRWHFRQSVLANMKGAGEPIFEHDFPPGTDVMKEILQGPCSAERMELELCSRLQGTQQEKGDGCISTK